MSTGTTPRIYSAGDILLADVVYTDGEGQKRRPIFVVSTSSFNKATSHVIYLPITSNPVPLGDYLPVTMEEGSLPGASNVVFDRLQSLKDARVVKRFGRARKDLTNQVLQRSHSLIASKV